MTLALVAFTVCFYAWSLLGPLGPEIQDKLHLSETQLAVTLAIPVLLGSLMRVPLGLFTARFGGRRVFTLLMGFTVLPLVALALFHESWGVILVFAFLLGFAGASFAVGVPFVNEWYHRDRQGFALGVYGIGMGGTVLAALTAPRISKATSMAVPFWIAAGLIALTAVVFWSAARDAPRDRASESISLATPVRLLTRRGAGRAWALTLFYFLAFGGFVA
ncbi:MAG: MFS transporter, partial [Acidobacteriota bacterium]|nr:MFS transporter [Acidobacteriota bacterium]